VVLALAGAMALFPAAFQQPDAASIGVTVAARAQQPGEVLVFTLTPPAGSDDLRVVAFNRTIPIVSTGPRTWRALVGIDLDVKPGIHTVTISARAGEHRVERAYALDVKARQFRTRTLEVDEAFVNPPPDAMRRIEEEAHELERLWNQSAAMPLWSGRFLRPVPGRATSSFGSRSVFNGEARSPHGGTDFLSPTGTAIKAPNAGRVMLAADLYFTGNTVIVDHGLGLVSMFAHLSEFAVTRDEMVSAGQVIGKVGATGRVTGPHLHWAVRLNGARVDPLSVLAVVGR